MTAEAHIGERIAPSAHPYAQALFELAEGEGAETIEQVEADLKALVDLVQSHKDLRTAVTAPTVDRAELARALGAVTERMEAHRLVRNVVGLAARNGRARQLPDIARAFVRRAAAARGEISGHVTTATTLEDNDRQRLQEALQTATGKPIKLAEHVDPEILGGLVLQFGSRMIDASVAARVNRARRAMKGAL